MPPDRLYTLVELPPCRVAIARGFGESPEVAAWSTLLEWAERTGADPMSSAHRFFGFDDPPPSHPGEPYGYQQWMTVEPGVAADLHEDVAIAEFEGGLYATSRCHGLENITRTWAGLLEAVDRSHVDVPARVGLEELLTITASDPADYVFDLYLPVTGG